MSALTWLGVALLGGCGAVTRVVLTERARDAVRGTLGVNLLGALALGLLAGAGVRGDVLLLAGGGFLGALTTFSTWMAQVVERRSTRLLLGPLALGLGAAAVGRMIGTLL